eukprot:IDg21748t1
MLAAHSMTCSGTGEKRSASFKVTIQVMWNPSENDRSRLHRQPGTATALRDSTTSAQLTSFHKSMPTANTASMGHSVPPLQHSLAVEHRIFRPQHALPLHVSRDGFAHRSPATENFNFSGAQRCLTPLDSSRATHCACSGQAK